MALESVTHIDDLNASNPTTSDGLSQGDDHIRNIKTALKTDFPNINGVVSASDEDLSACTNFEETLSATTSEVTVATGKTLNIIDKQGLKINSTPVDLLVTLDTPEELVDLNGVTQNSWTTVNSSTLNTAAATKAVLRIYMNTSVLSGLSGLEVQVWVRKTGSALAQNSATQVAGCRALVDSTALVLIAEGVAETTVNLDASYDFDYAYDTDSGGTGNVEASKIYLVGYYV